MVILGESDGIRLGFLVGGIRLVGIPVFFLVAFAMTIAVIAMASAIAFSGFGVRRAGEKRSGSDGAQRDNKEARNGFHEAAILHHECGSKSN